MTVLGRPDKRPWNNLRELTYPVAVTELAIGWYFICCSTEAGRV
jgi:hypothetical protein